MTLDDPSVRAAGIMHLTRDNHTLMVHRTDGLGWAFPGGRIEDGEDAEQAARREHREEMGVEYTGKLEPHTRRIDENADFTTFIARNSESFTPVLNDEHDEYRWIDRHKAVDELGPELHPGAKIALLKDDMHELDLAKAIRDGEIVSPQWYKGLLLIAMRITGTGTAFRVDVGDEEGNDEFVWRDPSFYLNDEFLQRCAGTLVILEHPEIKKRGKRTAERPPGTLTGKELSDRCVGSVLLPYIQNQEVWGITKIYDEVTARMLEKKGQTLSTSPCVVFRPEGAGSKYRLQDGSILLVEGKPTLLDHLAIDEHGVWDKGGEPSGVLNQLSEETIMADETAAPVQADASQEGSVADKIMARLDSLSTDWNKRWDSMSSRMDSFGSKEEPKGEEPTKDEGADVDEPGTDPSEEGKGEGPTSEGEGKPEALAEGGGEEALKEEREDNNLTKNDCNPEKPMGDVTKADAQNNELLRQRLEKLEARVPSDMPETERLQFVAVQAKSERVRQAFGDSAGAPRPLGGETLLQYRRRMLSDHQKHSPAWKDKDLSGINDPNVLGAIEDQVYSDALKASRNPSDVPEGTLRVVVDEDETGRRSRRFFGDPEACWGPFKQPAKNVVGWNNKGH